jgi:hypothetical protein
MREVSIYGIRLGETEQYVYVGATTNMRNRKLTGYSAKRIAAVLDGVDWHMRELEKCNLSDSSAREKFWIEKLSREGHCLENVAEPRRPSAQPVAPEPSSGATISEEERARRGQSKVLLRLSADLTERLEAVSRERDAPRALIVREALEAYLRRHRP